MLNISGYFKLKKAFKLGEKKMMSYKLGKKGNVFPCSIFWLLMIYQSQVD